MAIDIKALSCPQCGSTNVEMVSDTNGVCAVCGSQFIIQENDNRGKKRGRLQKYSSETVNEAEISCDIRRIKPEYNENDFIREAWITLANEDVPFDCFEKDFSDVKKTDRQVFFTDFVVDITYTVSIGYDRKEAYTDYETYYETVNGKSVKKKRQVTKYRTVTDWRPLSGHHKVESSVSVDNETGELLDSDLTDNCFGNVAAKSIILPNENDKDISVTSIAKSATESAHNYKYKKSLEESLPGDHHKELDYQIEIKRYKANLFFAPQYESTLSYGDKSVKKKGFPFGKMQVFGDRIAQRQSKESAWQMVKYTYWSVLALLFAAITASLILLFVNGGTSINARNILIILAAALLISKANTLFTRWRESVASKETEKRELVLLNNKLRSLGFEPVKESNYEY